MLEHFLCVVTLPESEEPLATCSGATRYLYLFFNLIDANKNLRFTFDLHIM